jgi:hypothetical protein
VPSILIYLRRNWVIYGLAGLYLIGIGVNAAGLNFWLPACLITEITGYSCFGCGLTTAIGHILTGELKQAFGANPLVFIYLPTMAYWIINDYHKFTIHLETTNA